MRKTFIRLLELLMSLGIILSLSGLSGCFKPVKTPPVYQYTLQYPSMSIGKKTHRSRVLMVNAPNAAAGYETSHMIYTRQPYELSHFAYHTWVAPPAHMLEPLLIHSLQQSGCWGEVVSSPYSGASNNTLNTQVLRLQQEFSGQSSQVRFTLKITLLDTVSGDVITSRLFESVVSADPTPYGGVEATQQAMRDLFSRINLFLCHQMT